MGRAAARTSSPSARPDSLDNDHTGWLFRTQDVAGGGNLWVLRFPGEESRFIGSLKTGQDVCTSPVRDAVKTMRVCHTIFAQALERGP